MVEPRARQRKPRIWLGLREIAGYYAQLAAGFAELGVPCANMCINRNRFAYARERHRAYLPRAAAAVFAARLRRRDPGLLTSIELGSWLLALFLWSLPRFDVFILGGKSGLPGHIETPLLKLFRRRVIHVFHGSDSRPPYLNGFELQGPEAWSLERCVRVTARIAGDLRRIEAHADHVVTQGTCAQLHRGRCLHFLAMGLPMGGARESRSRRSDGRVRILHAPSHPEGKGTARIRAVVSELQLAGEAIDYVELQGRPNAEVRRELADCDLVIDQLYSDTPMSALPAEAAWHGRPAVVGGYCREAIRRLHPRSQIPPTALCRPEELAETVAGLVRDRAAREALGRRAHAFAHGRWHRRRVAQRYLLALDGRLPASFFFRAEDCSYLHGIGFAEAELRATLRAIEERFGPAAFQLDDRPDLLRRVRAFASAGRA